VSDAGIINGAGVTAAVENSSGVNNSVNPLDKLEGVVVAAKLEAAQSAQTPTGQFMDQFGSVDTAPPAVGESSVADALVKDQTDGTVSSPPDEVAPQPEQTPADILKEKIAGNIDAFLEEVTKEKTAV
jgi:hypothetical protein